MASTESNFHFVLQSGAKVPKDPAVRTMIRKQAMKDIGLARRRKGNHGQAERRQQPAPAVQGETIQPATAYSTTPSNEGGDLASRTPTLDSGTNSSGSSPEDLALESCGQLIPTYDCSADLVDPFMLLPDAEAFDFSDLDFLLPPCMPLSAYESTRIKYNVDIQHLSILTGFSMGYHTTLFLSDHPTFLETLMRAHQSSYLQYVPSLYGNSECVTTATDCLVARVRWMLSVKTKAGLAEVYVLYAKALKALQAALNDPRQSQAADTLCATQILSVHEVSTMVKFA